MRPLYAEKVILACGNSGNTHGHSLSSVRQQNAWCGLSSYLWDGCWQLTWTTSLHLISPSLFSVSNLIFCSSFLIKFFSDSPTSLSSSSWSVCASFCPSSPAFNLQPFDFSSLDYLSLSVPPFPTLHSTLITLLCFWLLFIASPLYINFATCLYQPPFLLQPA